MDKTLKEKTEELNVAMEQLTKTNKKLSEYESKQESATHMLEKQHEEHLRRITEDYEQKLKEKDKQVEEQFTKQKEQLVEKEKQLEQQLEQKLAEQNSQAKEQLAAKHQELIAREEELLVIKQDLDNSKQELQEKGQVIAAKDTKVIQGHLASGVHFKWIHIYACEVPLNSHILVLSYHVG